MIDIHQLEALAADFGKVSVRTMPLVVEAVEHASQRVQDDARQLAPGAHGGSALHYPASITHDVTVRGPVVHGDIGPKKGGQGSLGHLFEHGVASRGMAPHAHLGPALDREEPRFAGDIAAAAARGVLL